MKNVSRYRVTAVGFSIVELVVVIAILSIIAAVAMARFSNGNAFEGIIVRDQIISLARTAQQNSFGRADVTMTIAPTGSGDVIIETTFDGVSIEQVTTSMSALSLSGDRNVTASCSVSSGGSAITNANPMVFTFGELGDIASPSGVSGSAGDVNSGLRVCINNDASLSVCVSPSGFAYIGDCDV